MIETRFIEDKEEKTRVTLEIMNALPEWFSPPENIVNKSVIHREYPFIISRNKCVEERNIIWI